MSEHVKRINNLDDIVFEGRNKEYGAFILRKKYQRSVIISLLVGIILMTSAIITPYFSARALGNRQKNVERQVEIKMENLDSPNEIVVPPPPPPPPDIVQQVKYVPPVVVDSVKSDEITKLMTADEVQTKVKNEDALEVIKEVKEEVQEDVNEHEPFISVQEMPEPVGGIEALYKYIAENVHYPPIAKENNIEGKVYIKFNVTSKGSVEDISILKGVSPDLDAEAIRIVKTFPPFKPGKQDGKPVPVWFTMMIIFKLQ